MLQILAAVIFVVCPLSRFAEADTGATCYVKTRDSHCCVFPFIYSGRKYYSCQGDWCATTPNYDVDGDWDYCAGMEMYLTADDKAWVYADGKYLGRDNGRWNQAKKYTLPLGTTLLAVCVKNSGGGPTGLLAKLSNGLKTDSKWKCTTQYTKGWEKTGDFNDYKWPWAVDYGSAYGHRVSGIGGDVNWIGPQDRNAASFYCRRKISFSPERPPIQGEGTCDEPLGMQSGWIRDSDIKASSIWDDKRAASRGRLNLWKQGEFIAAWVTRDRNTHQWLQVDFTRPTVVTGVGTQGREDQRQWVETYHLSYGQQENRMTQYKVKGKLKVFSGNSDSNSLVRNRVNPPIETRLLRINPMTYHGHIALRAEFYGCTKACKVDVGVLMDESGSVSKEDFEREKNFVINFAGHFHISRNAAQFGIISYSTAARLDIKLNQFSGDLRLLQYTISTIRHGGGRTYTNKALTLAKSDLYNAANGARDGVAKVLFVITDGRSSNGINSLRAPVKALKDASVNIFSIGVGEKIRKEELELMASDKSHVYYVEKMADLQNIVDAITTQSCTEFNCPYVKCHYGPWSSWTATCGQNLQRAKTLIKTTDHTASQQGGCSGLPQTCDQRVTETTNIVCPCKAVKCSWDKWSAWSATCGRITRQRKSIITHHLVNRPNGCNGIQTSCPAPETESMFVSCCKADIGFILDDSGSLSNGEYHKQKDFVARLADGFANFGSDGIQMSAMRFSNKAELHVPFNQHADKHGFMQAVKAIPRRGGYTHTDKALMLAHNEMFSSTFGARKGATKVLFIITDGGSTGGLDSIKDPVKQLKDSGVNIFSIGVGNRINQQELNYMASDPVKSHIYFVKNMQELSGLLEQLATSSCHEFTCKYVTCEYSQWSKWSKSCGAGITRVKKLTKTKWHIIKKQGGCSGLNTTCLPAETEIKDELCSCKYVTCEWEAWGEWTTTCGSASRTRKSKTTERVVQKLNCDGLQTSCPAPETEQRVTNCPCQTVQCIWQRWTDWSATCGYRRRTRSIKAVPVTVHQPSCAGLPSTCSEKPEVEEESSPMCKCLTVKCEWNAWSDWSATCGDASRTRTIKTTQVTVERPVCDELPSTCTQQPETQKRRVMCTCPTVNCTWNAWSDWSASCGKATRQRTIKTTHTNVQQLTCDGLPQKCNEQPETDQRETMCTCPTVKCTWNQWSDWSASCGKATRQRTINTEHTVVQLASCDGLPQTCTEKPQTDQRETMCTCATVKCTWNKWGAWSATCGKATRQRTINTEHTVVQQASCDGLPQTCTEKPQTDQRETMCTCATVKCTWNKWGAWSATCGKATRQRTINMEHTTVQQVSCDGLPQSCTESSETDTRVTTCPCPTVNCTLGPWGKWSGDCGKVFRERNTVETKVTVQKESCDGLPQACDKTPVKEEKQLKDCELCFTVECKYSPWSSWSASCGPATRTRTQITEEIEVEAASCDGLPLECHGQMDETQTRDTPCPATTLTPTAPPTAGA